MKIITLTSDFGLSDYYVACIKAVLLRSAADCHIVDISHQIEKFSIAHAAFVVRSVFDEFPKGSVHLIDVHTPFTNRFLLAEYKGHYFLAADNGVISLICDAKPNSLYEIYLPRDANNNSPAQSILAPAAVKLIRGSSFAEIGSPTQEFHIRNFRKPSHSRHKIKGNVIRIDDYGNLITNIDAKLFHRLGKNRPFEISFSRETLFQLSKTYHDVSQGDCLALFNQQDLLEIAINHGNAAQLLGIYFDSEVNVVFEQN